MKSGTHLRTGALVLFALLAIAAQPSAWGQTFTTFDPPGSLGTSPTSINPAGQITGNYPDSNFLARGFLRDTDGTLTSFDAPGASFPGTFPAFITPQGSIVGTYFDANFGTHVFQRAKDGTITTFEDPSPGAFIYGFVGSSAGGMAGAFFGSNGPELFLRSPNGKVTLIPFPPAFLEFFFVPNITAMTPGGTILGSYFDSNGVIHGFLRTADGKFTTFDAPNAAAGFFSGTTPASINDAGTVAGFYNDTAQNSDVRVFLRSPNGVFSSFDTPVLAAFGGAASINSSGAVAGDFFCGAAVCPNQWTGFLRTADGKVSPVNDSSAGLQGTRVTGINLAGEIIGFYFDQNGVQHGFVEKR